MSTGKAGSNIGKRIGTDVRSLLLEVEAGSAQAVEIEIVQRGIYELERRSAERPTLLASTTVIPAELGNEFGFEFNVRGTEAGPSGGV